MNNSNFSKVSTAGLLALCVAVTAAAGTLVVPIGGNEPPRSVATASYSNSSVDLSFSYPSGWRLEERAGRSRLGLREYTTEPFNESLKPADGLPAPVMADAPGVAVHSISLYNDNANSSGVIVVFARPDGPFDFAAWVNDRYAGAGVSGDLAGRKAVIQGQPAYAWRASENGRVVSTTVVVEGDDFLYLINFQDSEPGRGAMRMVTNSFDIGGEGPTVLPSDFTVIEDRGLAPVMPLAECNSFAGTRTCGNCSEVDAGANSYSCCTAFGNCTWKSEEQRAGDGNFYFNGPPGRDAHRWLDLGWDYTSYMEGGTIPQTGAVAVFSSQLGGFGHVGTVTSTSSNGSITLREQNCCLTCTRTKAYPTSTLMTYLCGYIYPGESAPAPTAKAIASSGETVVQDFGFSSTYNFGSYGPGSDMSWNGGYRAWGTSTSGRGGWMHYIASSSSLESFGAWRAYVQAGVYEVQAWIPNSDKAGATSIVYNLNNQVFSRPIDQSANRGRWVKIVNPGRADGNWNFSTTGSYYVFLADQYAATSGQWIAMDDLKFIKR